GGGRSWVSAGPGKRAGRREISRTFSCSVPESTTSPNQPISAMPNVITPYGPGVSWRASQIWIAMPISRATHSPAASVRKLRRTPLRQDWPKRARPTRARKSGRSAPGAASEASTGPKGSSLLGVPTDLLDRLEVRLQVAILAPQPPPGVPAPRAELVPEGRVRTEALDR